MIMYAMSWGMNIPTVPRPFTCIISDITLGKQIPHQTPISHACLHNRTTLAPRDNYFIRFRRPGSIYSTLVIGRFEVSALKFNICRARLESEIFLQMDLWNGGGECSGDCR